MAKKAHGPSAGSTAGSTPATVALMRAGIKFEVRGYEHDARDTDFGGEAARKLGVAPERVFKTLLAEVDGALTVAVLPVTGMLDLKALAQARGGKRANMADPAVAEKKTGYVVGGISPIGQRTKLPVVIDESAERFETVLVSGGRRGVDIELAPQDLLLATRGEWGAVATLAAFRPDSRHPRNSC